MINKIINIIGSWLIKFSDDELEILAGGCTCLIVAAVLFMIWFLFSLTIYGLLQYLESIG